MENNNQGGDQCPHITCRDPLQPSKKEHDMPKTVQENINKIQQLLDQGYEYIVKDEEGPLVATSARPQKFEDMGEWGSIQTLNQSNKAIPVDSDYLTIVQWADEEPLALSDAKAFYKVIATLSPETLNETFKQLGLLTPEEDDEPSAALQGLFTLWSNGMEYIVIQPNDEVNVFQSMPVFDNTQSRWISSDPAEFRTVITTTDEITEYFKQLPSTTGNQSSIGKVDELLMQNGFDLYTEE